MVLKLKHFLKASILVLLLYFFSYADLKCALSLRQHATRILEMQDVKATDLLYLQNYHCETSLALSHEIMQSLHVSC